MKLPFVKKHEFRPDRQGTSTLRKLWPTPQQQVRILRWALYGVLSLIALLLQDVLLYRVNVVGGCTDAAPCLVLMVTVLAGAESGSIFALIASVLYFFSGSSQGFYVIPLLTAIAVFAAVFRQAFLRRGFFALLACVGLGMLLYELSLFGISLFLQLTVFTRIRAALMTAVLSLAIVPIAYPLLLAIGKLGGDPWGE